MQITLPFNTVLLLIGPTNSGKSYFSSHVKSNVRPVYISSDECRRDVMGGEATWHKHSKYSSLMLQASSEAFKILRSKLEGAMSFPMSLHNGVIILDSTALNEGFRKEITELCRSFHWNLACLVFDYKDGIPEYEKYSKDVDTDLIRSHLTKLRHKVRPTLRKSDFNAGVFTVGSKSEIDDISLYINLSKARRLSIEHSKYESNSSYLIIGDVHGCYKEFTSLITKAGFEIRNGVVRRTPSSHDHIVLLGDLVDKGPMAKEVIDLIFKTIIDDDDDDLFIPILGNHDLFFHQWFSKERECNEEKRRNYYDSTITLKDDKQARIAMEVIYDFSIPYFFNNYFICTHAPCPSKYLGKDDDKSISHQVKLRFDRYKEEGSFDDFCKEVSNRSLSFMKKQDVHGWPYLFSGHIQVDRVTKVGTQIMLDTGAVYGNELSGCIIKGRKYHIISVKSEESYAEGRLLSLFQKDPLSNIELTPVEKRRLRAMTSSCPVNFISGTMAPAPAHTESLTLESLEQALSIFKQDEEKNVVLQTKAMGSRAQIYLVRGQAPDKRPGVYQFSDFYCYWISRNGFLIKADLEVLSQEVASKYFSDDMELLILDGELLPWSVLGEGLISEVYKPYIYEMQDLISDLESMGTHEEIENLKATALESNFSRLSKEERTSKFKPHQITSLDASLRLSKSLPSLEVLKDNLSTFKRQIDNFGVMNVKPSYQPFSVLKHKKIGQSEAVLPNDNFIDGLMMGKENCIMIDVDDVTTAKSFFKEKQMLGLEGIVVKPVGYDSPIPSIKVRDETGYLSLVYGPNFRHEPQYRKHVERKEIGSKLRSSKAQWNLSKELLDIPYELIPTSEEAKRIIFCFIQDERKDLDPRL